MTRSADSRSTVEALKGDTGGINHWHVTSLIAVRVNDVSRLGTFVSLPTSAIEESCQLAASGG
jgi:hypothetical protein